jgi:hypothetical protein
MTLNQVIARIRSIILAHKQVRNFYFGGPTSEFLNDHTTRYPSAFLQDTPGNMDLAGKTDNYGFRLYLLDLANVSEDARTNELDVQSDMRSIVKDLLAEFNHSSFQDWKISSNNAVALLREELDDLTAGVYVDFTISSIWIPDTCIVPTEPVDIPNIDDMKYVYDEKYTANGTEGSTLTISAIKGKKIILLTRESAVLYKVSSNPDSVEYTWDGIDITLGTPINSAGERFLILYRNY